MKRPLFLLILILGLAEFGYGAWIPAKARLSQILLASAWQDTLLYGQAQKPWPWADTFPVLRLQHKGTDTDLLVLESDSGQALAFGPGYMGNSPLPGRPGNTVIGGHRDTHFTFLKQVQVGEEITVQDRFGTTHRYRVESAQVVDSTRQQLVLDTEDDRLTLVTCYPFDALVAGGPLRYVLVASYISSAGLGKKV